MRNCYKNNAIFCSLATCNHLHSLQIENCDSNSWLVVDEDDVITMVNSGLKGFRKHKHFSHFNLWIAVARLTQLQVGENVNSSDL